MLITFGDARRGQQGLGPRPQLAIAARDPAVVLPAEAVMDRLPASASAEGTNFLLGFGQLLENISGPLGLNLQPASSYLRHIPGVKQLADAVSKTTPPTHTLAASPVEKPPEPKQ